MAQFCESCLLSLAILLLLSAPISSSSSHLDNGKIITATYLTPKIVLEPGSVADKWFYNLDFPRGHIFVKSFNAEVIDESGNPMPLYETYLHHWVVSRYYKPKNASITENNRLSILISAGNSGICQGDSNSQYFGVGSETRKTATHVPDPYGIEVGNPADIPAEYEETWALNVHVIDTRGVEDTLGCTECKCELYNVTVDAFGRPLRPEYKGGLLCCHDQTQCRLRQGFQGSMRTYYLRYTVKWVDWDRSVIPVKIFIFDVTDTGKRVNGSSEIGCQVEYDVQGCRNTDTECVDVKRTNVIMPTGGYVIYGVVHQHAGAIGSTLYGQDGRVICISLPIYGEGKEAGNEAGYLVGTSTCYPKPGSVRIGDGEELMLESNYSSIQMHTGVMGIFYILVADHDHIDGEAKLSIDYSWTWTAGVVVALVGLAIIVAMRQFGHKMDPVSFNQLQPQGII